MCLDLRNSQFKSIDEVETILNDCYNATEQDIINMKDDRDAIEQALKDAQAYQELALIYGF